MIELLTLVAITVYCLLSPQRWEEKCRPHSPANYLMFLLLLEMSRTPDSIPGAWQGPCSPWADVLTAKGRWSEGAPWPWPPRMGPAGEGFQGGIGGLSASVIWVRVRVGPFPGRSKAWVWSRFDLRGTAQSLCGWKFQNEERQGWMHGWVLFWGIGCL